MTPLKYDSPTSLSEGLSAAQAAEAKPNTMENRHQESTGELILSQFFTFFNIVNYILAGLIILTDSYRNLLFMVVVISNTLIGLIQKIRSRRTLNKLALIHQQTYSVLRDGKWESLPVDQIVQNDILRLSSGAQIPCDCRIREGFCQVNESLLTGESDALDRSAGQDLYGGCFLVSGSVLVQAIAVGDDQYMASILHDARKDKERVSQLQEMLDMLIKFCTLMLVPAGVLLFLKLFFYTLLPLNSAILNTCASVIGMIPEGLMILTSTALAAASVKMARQAVLIHDLYSVESLARVDTLCLDKTGTITSGNMHVQAFLPQGEETQEQLKQDLADLFGSLGDDNVTAKALRTALQDWHSRQKAARTFPFSSTAKCSGAVFGDQTYLIGAYTFLFAHPDPAVLDQIEDYAARGLRVLAFAKGPELSALKKGDYTLCGLILIEDELRPDAPQILDYFRTQDVSIKVISGDMAQTVQAIAGRAGVKGKAIDMQNVSDDQIEDVVSAYSIFGRVSPVQKKLMVEALQKQGHTVGMTGDGVNDVMALKQADCSIAMGSGAQAALAVSSFVLLNNQFSVLPRIVLEGRRVVNNIQRTASLFLVKTIFSFILCVLTVLWMRSYPFIPIQLTLVSSLGTGIPAFILTFENDTKRIQGNFLVSVLSRATPGALSVCLSIATAYILYVTQWIPMDQAAYQTICTILASVNAIGVLYWICRPLSLVRLLVITLCAAGYAGVMVFVPSLFSLAVLNPMQLIAAGAIALGELFVLSLLQKADWHHLYARFLPSFLKEEKQILARENACEEDRDC